MPTTTATKQWTADWTALKRTFIEPDTPAGRETLVKYMEQILFGLQTFLGTHVGITEEASLEDLARQFTSTTISTLPEKHLAQIIAELIEDIAPHAVNVASPYFVGHMTSAIPFFMVHLKTIVAALNQNVVKVETSKVVSIIEKQVLAKLHRMVFKRSPGFYKTHVQHPDTTLGSFVEDGTLANLTALWMARNTALPPLGDFAGVESDGLAHAYRAHGVDRAVVLVSRLGHYSLRKAGGVLGIGNRNVVAIASDRAHRIQLSEFERQVRRFSRPESRTRIVAAVGIAGATETGTVDPLGPMAEICHAHGVHFHVDAAWGGPVLLSREFHHVLDGIDQADSVTIDGHKQFYLPMTCGIVVCRNPRQMDAVAYHARYINRPGSVDLGIKSLSGSRESVSLILDSSLKIMGGRGYGLLIEHGMRTARMMATAIEHHPGFELITAPTLNILTYRLHPPGHAWTREELNAINIAVQRIQREAGRSFVSRTTLFLDPKPDSGTVVLRVVIMNPFTDMDHLQSILEEQWRIWADGLATGDLNAHET